MPPRPTSRQPSGDWSNGPGSSPTPGFAPALGPRDSVVDLSEFEEVPTRTNLQRWPATTPLRPLIDIAQPQVSLTVEREGGNLVQRSIVHEGDVCRIGTHASNDLVLVDPAVSRFHCRLALDSHGWRVQDTGSLNGTRLENLQIIDALVPSEAVLTIGNSVVRVRSGDTGARTLVPMMPSFGSLTGTGRAMRKLFVILEKVAQSEINVFINGESGTGKELVATEIVQRGGRADKPFVVVDCGAISPTLVESELFGHVRGAFTGADRDRVGAFESAEGGTVFLDEIGELPLAVQPKLLRALEQREIRRVGETRARKVNVRVLCATNRDLEREVNKGSFREDLYFRLAVVTVRVPPLRERIEDLPYLIRSFLTSLNAPDEEHLFPPEVLEELAKHEWPGNVRELRNYVERSVVLKTAKLTMRAPSASVTNEAGGSGPRPVDVSIPFKVAKETLIDAFERAYIKALLEACGGNMTRAARQAGIDRMYLHRIVQKHGLRGGGPPSTPSTPPGDG
ncbi:MAG: Response regulator of zinc sigma-54-dependent two-component system [Myxococcaceae bacterium]|nr:Response regulator of zinc sigma-54-dependent two-component system [Myxococcaceae bacterium]